MLGRNAIGTDINTTSLLITRANLNFTYNEDIKIHTRKCDARNLSFIKDESIDFICTHPPYANIIKYSNDIVQDISLLNNQEFVFEMNRVASESFRVLKNRKFCAIMMGDIRKDGNIIPLGFKVMECFLNVGFKSKEIIIKEQHNCNSSKIWTKRYYPFLLLAHEYIFVFVK